MREKENNVRVWVRAREGARGDGDTFFGCNFLSAPATKRFDQSLNPLSKPLYSSALSRHPPPPPFEPLCTCRYPDSATPLNSLTLLARPRESFGYIVYTRLGCPLLRLPLALSLPPPSTNLATVSVLNHICDAFFFLPLFS